MAEPGDIRIGIDISLTPASRETIRQLSELTKYLENIARAGVSTGAVSEGLSDRLLEIGGQVKKITEYTKPFLDYLKQEGVDLKEVSESIRALKIAQGALSVEQMVTKIQTEALTRSLTDYFTATQVSEKETERAVKSLQEFSRAGMANVNIVEALSASVKTMGVSLPTPILKELVEIYRDQPQMLLEAVKTLGQYRIESSNVAQALDILRTRGVAGLIEFEQANAVIAQRLREISQLNKTFLATLGAMGLAQRDVARQLFWTSLGLMFTSMALGRVTARQFELERSSISYIRTLRALEKARQAYNDALAAGDLEEVRERAIDLYEAELNLRLQEEQLALRYKETWFSMAMLYLGLFPTAIRTGEEFGLMLVRLGIAKRMETAETVNSAIAQSFYNSQMLTGTVMVLGFKLSVDKLIASLSVLTFFIPLIVSQIANFYAELKAREDIEKFKREMEDLHRTLTLPRSPSLLQSFEDLSGNLDKISRARLPSFKPIEQLQEFKITPVEPVVTRTPNIMVNVHGPFYVREEEDIERIASAVGDETVATLSRLGMRLR